MQQRPLPKVLVVDDEPAIRELLTEYLERNHFATAQAIDAESAMVITQQEQFDLVIMDVRMPGTSGIDALREIKQDHPDQQVMMMTGASEIQTAVEAMQLGAADYVLKPFALSDLLAKIDQAITNGLGSGYPDYQALEIEPDVVATEPIPAYGVPLDEEQGAPISAPANPLLADVAVKVERLYAEIRELRVLLRQAGISPETRLLQSG